MFLLILNFENDLFLKGTLPEFHIFRIPKQLNINKLYIYMNYQEL